MDYIVFFIICVVMSYFSMEMAVKCSKFINTLHVGEPLLWSIKHSFVKGDSFH